MRFLVVTMSKTPMPPEAMPMLLEGMTAWVDEHRSSGKFEQVWSFAGLQGGGGILNVDSLDELDAIMADFPFGPFSDITIYGLADLDAGLAGFRRAIEQMAGAG